MNRFRNKDEQDSGGDLGYAGTSPPSNIKDLFKPCFSSYLSKTVQRNYKPRQGQTLKKKRFS